MPKISEITQYMEIAKKQIGITELPPGSNTVKYNTDYYGREVSGPNYKWCMVFIWWCLKEAGFANEFGKKTASCTQFRDWHRDKIVTDHFKYGDIILFNFSRKANTIDPRTTTCEHCGFYFTSTGTTITTIDGNTSTSSEDNGGAVMKRTRMREKVVCGIRLFGDLNPIRFQSSTLPVLYKGLDIPAIKSLQLCLNNLGYDCGKVDGIFGEKTESAVRRIQKDHGIICDGEVGKDTYKLLFPTE